MYPTTHRRVVPFQAQHLEQVLLLGLVEPAGSWLSGPSIGRLLEEQNCYTVLVDDCPVACYGTVQFWPGVSQAILLFTAEARPMTHWVFRHMRRFLDSVPGRVEATVTTNLPEGQRTVRALGFWIENPPGILRKYGLNGEDHIAYVRFAGEKH